MISQSDVTMRVHLELALARVTELQLGILTQVRGQADGDLQAV